MAQIIDISARLDASKPQLKFSETEIYDINDDKNNVIKADQMFRGGGDDDMPDLDKMSKALEMFLGKTAIKEIEKNHPGATTKLSAMRVIFTGIMAAINGWTIEEADARFQQG